MSLELMKMTLQSVASSIIETQEAMEVLREETELTLKIAGEHCRTLEAMVDKLSGEITL